MLESKRLDYPLENRSANVPLAPTRVTRHDSLAGALEFVLSPLHEASHSQHRVRELSHSRDSID
jgi:hypothetical protein